MPSLVEIGPAVLEMTIFKCRQCIFAIFRLSFIEKRRGPLSLQIPFTSDALWEVQWFLRR